MPRQARLDAPSTLPHVMGWGIAAIRLFRAVADGEGVLGRLAHRATERYLRVHAWASLSTHFHPLLRIGAQPLATSMR